MDCVSFPQAPNQEALCFQNLYGEWEEKYNCKIITSTRGTFMDMFDDDDTLVYEPAMTGAIILTGEDDEAEKAALEVRLLPGTLCCDSTCHAVLCVPSCSCSYSTILTQLDYSIPSTLLVRTVAAECEQPAH